MDACVRCKAGIPDSIRICPYCEAPQFGKVSKSVEYCDALIVIVQVLSAIVLFLFVAFAG